VGHRQYAETLAPRAAASVPGGVGAVLDPGSTSVAGADACELERRQGYVLREVACGVQGHLCARRMGVSYVVCQLAQLVGKGPAPPRAAENRAYRNGGCA